MKVLAAMSGGVDSAVAAARAVAAGHEVIGVHLALSTNPATLRTGSRGCCSREDAGDARRVADMLGIPFYVWDFAERFREDVIDDVILAIVGSLSLLLGALAFQHLGGLAPCKMCIWQRWPHAAAVLIGLVLANQLARPIGRLIVDAPAVPPRPHPIVQRRADVADMEPAGRGGREAAAIAGAGRGRRWLGLPPCAAPTPVHGSVGSERRGRRHGRGPRRAAAPGARGRRAPRTARRACAARRAAPPGGSPRRRGRASRGRPSAVPRTRRGTRRR